jgi:hypothetical protein
MTRFVAALSVAAILAALPAGSARSQTQTGAPAATPSSAPSATPVSAPAPDEKQSASRAKQHASERADARVCLEFPTNLQIIKCAEKYRYMRAPGS